MHTRRITWLTRHQPKRPTYSGFTELRKHEFAAILTVASGLAKSLQPPRSQLEKIQMFLRVSFSNQYWIVRAPEATLFARLSHFRRGLAPFSIAILLAAVLCFFAPTLHSVLSRRTPRLFKAVGASTLADITLARRWWRWHRPTPLSIAGAFTVVGCFFTPTAGDPVVGSITPRLLKTTRASTLVDITFARRWWAH